MSDPQGWNHWEKKKESGFTDRREGPFVGDGFEERSPEDVNPWGAYYFGLEIDGIGEVAHFTECSGLKSSAEVYEIQEGGLNGHVHKRTSRSKWDNIVLKYATSLDEQLLSWRDKFLQDDFASMTSTSGAIIMYNNAGEEVRRFNFVNAWPVGWEGPTLTAGSSELGMETLEIAHEGLYVDYTPEPVPDPEPEPDPPDQIDAPPVQFDYNSADLTPEGAQVCKDVAKELDRLEIEDIWVEGHTCTMGSFAYNQSLSDQRAYSVVKELKAQSADSTRRYNSMGFAWKYQVASNATTAGKESNRRTEFMTSSWTDRGMDGKRVTPEERKNSAPWNHR